MQLRYSVTLQFYFLIYNIRNMNTFTKLTQFTSIGNRLCHVIFTIVFLLTLQPGIKAQSTFGSIEGTVTDDKGEPLIGVAVLASDPSTGLSRGTTTDEDGNYQLLSLPRGVYNVTASYLGYQTIEKQNTKLMIGQILRLDFQMQETTVNMDEILVIAQSDAVEMRQTSVATPIATEQIEYLPVFSRNILSLGQLAPGARSFDGNAADFNSGASEPGVQSATGAVFGQYIVDGLNTKGRTAGASITGNVNDVWLSQLVVDEMRFITHGYDAQYEGGTEVTVIETKRGTNNFEVTAFANGYQDWMRAQGPLEETKPEGFYRYQSGVFASGPIIRDKLFFAASYERNDEIEPTAFVIPDDPLFSNYERLINNEVGYTLWSAKLTAQPNSKNLIDLSWFARRDDHDVVLPGANTREFGWTQDQVTDNFILRHRYTPNSKINNEFIASYRFNQWLTTSLSQNPLNLYSNYGFFEGPMNIFWPLEQLENQTNITNNFQIIASNHVVKIGGSYEYSDLTYDWPLLSQPFIIYAEPGVPLLGQIGVGRTDQTENSNDAFTSIPAHHLAFFAQDDWQINDRLLLSFGLRYSSNLGHLNNDFVLDDTNARKLTEAGVPEEYIAKGDRKNFHNLGPRLRFSYDLSGDDRTVLFGGYARSYDRPPLNDVNAEARGFNWLQATVPFEALGGFPFSTDPAVLRGYAASLGVDNITPNVTLLSNDVANPVFDDFSLGINQRIAPKILGTLNFAMKNMSNGFASYNFNPFIDGGSTRRVTTDYGDIFLADDTWSSSYRAMMMTVRRNFSDGWMFQFNYTLASVKTELQRPLEEGVFEDINASTDERHRFLLTGIYTLPFNIRISGIITLASPTPRNAITGSDDNLDGDPENDFLDGQPFNWRPEGFENWYRNFDLNLAKTFNLGNGNSVELRVDAFNLFNFDNFSAFQVNRMAPNFGDPVAAFNPRRVQLGVRYHFKQGQQ
ncbi:TonB-dependent receptor [Phaeodactylibacter xiamenensis]|uniref:TonB-dependent receptor n=1 Tax=Phaeodactylibacter xiamenensis TaxID=1524460 RepID=UPI003CCB93B6